MHETLINIERYGKIVTSEEMKNKTEIKLRDSGGKDAF